jgi:uroporphyrinogen III methyltransferase / synthase
MKRVLITRPKAQARQFASALESAGFEPVFFPVIETRPAADTTALDEALINLADYSWVVLTSVNGVEVVWGRLKALGLDQIPPGVRLAAIGPKTAGALRERGWQPDFVPDEYVADAILPGLGDVSGLKVLLPRAELARKDLADDIRGAGGTAHEITAYHTLPVEPEPHALQELHRGIDIVTLTSSSTVYNFVSLVEKAGFDPLDLPGNPVYACIGPITAATARELGLPISIEAGEYTTEGLVAALRRAFTQSMIP